MLPSMPLLMTPVKELADESSDSSDESPFHGQSEGSNGKVDPVTDISPTLLETDKDLKRNVDTIPQEDPDKFTEKSPDKRSLSEPTSAQKKKKKTHHKKTIAALTPDTGDNLENSAQNFAEAYFQKAKSLLTEEKWTEFVQELVDFEAKADKRPAELYQRMEVLLSPHSELINEFLAFLLPHQALQANRFIPYLVLVKMKEFFRKMNILLLKRQCQQVLSALECLSAGQNVTLADVRASLLPLIKSSPLLTDLLLELLPGERPPDRLMTDFEQVDLKDESQFETVVVPDCPDPYGHDKCICPCHAVQKNRHCVSCGIKYLNGRVYLQYGKVLRPAKVTFAGNTPGHLHLKKLDEDKVRSRRRLVPKSLLSPSCTADSEEDCGVKKSPRTPRTRTPRPKVCKKVIASNKDEGVLEGIFPLVETKPAALEVDLHEKPVDIDMKQESTEEHEFDEVITENECNTEEDEEEEAIKCLQSENESSLEGEDIGKDLEMANDCSFEDEDMDDIENDLSFEGLELNFNNDVESPVKSEDITCEFVSSINPDDTNRFHETDERKDLMQDLPERDNVVNDMGDKNKTLNIVGDEPNICKMAEEAHSLPSTSSQATAAEAEYQIKVEKEEITDVEMKVEHEEIEANDMDISNGDSPIVDESSCGSRKPVEVESCTREWTREEDKIILQTFQHENELEQTFETASLQLPNRSKEEIQERFEVLLKLLKEMISDKSSSK